MEINNYYEYYDSKKKKFVFLTVYIDEKNNLFQKNLYYNISDYFLYNIDHNIKIHEKVNEKIEVYVPSYFTDNKVKLYNVSKDIQNNINNFLSITVNLDRKLTDYYILENFNQNIIITKKYKLDGSQYNNLFQLYIKKNLKYQPNGISYLIEEHNYRPGHYLVFSMIKRIIYFYITIIIFFIIFMGYYISNPFTNLSDK